jgi:S-DNA-T family DNA segregation ATPase FtsK/SpoIIIE
MRRVITGEQVAQIYNPDPFARPVWRAPVYQTPAGIILLAWLVKLIIRLARLVFRHPVAAVVVGVLGFMWVSLGWPGSAALVTCAVVVLVT